MMKHNKPFYTPLLLMLSISTTSMLHSSVTPYYAIRSQGVNAARHLVGTTSQMYKIDKEKIYGTLGITPEYTRTFRNDHIRDCLFNESLINCDTIAISGSSFENRNQKEWLADYLYLPNDFKSTLSFEPVIDNFLFDLNWYFALDGWKEGLYFALYAPLVHTRWNLTMCEKVAQYGVNAQPAGLLTPAELNRGIMNQDATTYFAGTEISPVMQNVQDVNSNTVLQPLKYAKMSCERKIKTRFADIRALLGWNINREHYHFGFNIEAAAPAGNRPQGEFLFEPIVGNGHHWEFGGGITGHYTFWRNQEETTSVGIYADSHLTHLFKSGQKRTFDLINKPFSRYMLAQKFDTPIDKNLKGNGQTPTGQRVNAVGVTEDVPVQFKKEFAPLANLSTLDVEVSVTIQADIALMLNVTHNQFSWDLGYNLWARSCEDVKIRNINVLDNNITWALKGDARVFGFANQSNATDPAIIQNEPVALSATQNRATMHAGTNQGSLVNAGIDNPELATAGGADVPLNRTPGINEQINTSINPIFIDESDLNICASQTRGLSSKLFTHLSYRADERSGWIPQIGIGGEIEIDHSNNPSQNKEGCCTTDCMRCAVSQWGVWVKATFSFE
jgi:hypothetical protein